MGLLLVISAKLRLVDARAKDLHLNVSGNADALEPTGFLEAHFVAWVNAQLQELRTGVLVPSIPRICITAAALAGGMHVSSNANVRFPKELLFHPTASHS